MRLVWVVVLLLLGVSAQVSADWLAGGALLWDSQHLISEQSEYGHFLNALVGYEATPSSSQMVVYLVTVLILAALCWRQGEFR